MNDPSRPLLSATVIVRDESTRLGRCLASIAAFVDEIVIVDTGSTEGSVDVVSGFGARVHREPWSEDFSYHRNQAIALTRGEWVLVVDGDEELKHGAYLRAAVEEADPHDEIDGLTVWVDVREGGETVEQLVSVRAFRRARGRYERPVHEQLAGLRDVRSCRARVVSHERGTAEARAERSRPVLERMLAADPHDLHALFHLARTYFALEEVVNCKEACDALRSTPLAGPAYAPVWVWATWCALKTEGIDAAERVLAEGLARHPRFVDLRHWQVSLAALRWNESLGHLHEHVTTPFTSALHHGNIAKAGRLLGLPVRFDDRPYPFPVERARVVTQADGEEILITYTETGRCRT